MEAHLGADHRGSGLKALISEHLRNRGCTVVDHGADGAERVDYPEFAAKVGKAVVASTGPAFGVVVCGSGVGIAIPANKIAGVRCVVAWCEHVAEYGRRHNHANLLAFGSDVQTETQVLRCLDAYLGAETEGDRHAQRVAMIAELDANR